MMSLKSDVSISLLFILKKASAKASTVNLLEGGIRVCGDAVLRYFWCGFAVIFILTCSIAVLKH